MLTLKKYYMILKESLVKGKYKKVWKSLFWVSILATTFLTTYFLILPAITVETQKTDNVGISLSSSSPVNETPKEITGSPPSSDYQTEPNSGVKTEDSSIQKEVSDSSTNGPTTARQVNASKEETVDFLEDTLIHKGEGYEIHVTVGKEAKLPLDTHLEVSEVNEMNQSFETYKSKTLEKVSRKDDEIKSLFFYDITLVSNGKEMQPSSAVKVEVVYDKPLEVSDEELEIVHFKDNGTLEVLKSKTDPETVDSSSDIAFKTESFSVYAIVQPDNTTIPLRTYIFENVDGSQYLFKTNNNTETDTQIIKDGQSLHGVGIPYVDDDKHFNGWYIFNKDTNTYGDEIHFEEAIEVKQTETIYVRPSYGNVVYVTFYDNEDGTLVLEKHQVALEEGKGTVNLAEHTAVSPSATQVFAGWSLTKGGSVITENITNYPIAKDTVFYPIFKESKKIEFNTGDIGEGAPYVAPKFVIEGEKAESIKPTDPTRNGYTFGGWYRDSNYQTAFDFSSTVTEDIVLYAKWLPATANYTIVYWQQSKTDSKNSLAADKTYDYAGQVSRTATVDSIVSLTSSDRNPDSKGFVYTNARGETSTVVKADGSSIINVYFDRKLITMRFLNDTYYRSYTGPVAVNSTVWTSPTYAQYVTTYTGLYGTSLAENGYTWPSSGTQNWTYYASGGQARGMSYLGEFILPEDSYDTSNTEIRFYRSGRKTVNYYFYKQNIDGTYSSTPTDVGSGQMATFTFSEKYSGFNVAWYRRYYSGTTSSYDSDWRKAANNGTTQTFYTYGTYYNSVDYPLDLHIQYDRKAYHINFLDPLNNQELTNFDPVSVYYEDNLSKYKPDTTIDKPTPSLPGYRWDGKWYKDQTLTQEIDWSITMPSHDLKVYAGWEKIRYDVTIEANGGELLDTQATYFTLDYGEKISEYANITRDYVEDPNGEYYYRHDTDNGLATDGRHAHYTKDPTEPNVDTTKRYRYEKDAYKLVGWYYVNADGTTRPYNFSGIVVGDTTLRAIWRRVGEYKINYSPIVYDYTTNQPMVDDEGNAVLATNLPIDGNSYDDQSHSAMLTRPTVSGEYRFRGWYYNGKIYNPHDEFIIDAELADENKIIHIYPVFKSVDDLNVETTRITYDGNGGEKDVDGKTVTHVSEEDLLINTVKTLPKETYFDRVGYNLVGWNTNEADADAGHIQFELGQEVGVDNLPNSENVLYAVWQPKLYSVTISKKVIGNESDKVRSFTFTPGGALTSANFALKDGEVKVYQDIPYGSTISIDEQYNEAYTTIERVTHTNLASGKSDRTYEKTGLVELVVDGNIEINFVNERRRQNIYLQKVDVGNLLTGLKNAEFTLYKVENGQRQPLPDYEQLVSDSDGYLTTGKSRKFSLDIGNYQLIETKAPDGYLLEENPIDISVTSTSVSLIQNGNASEVTVSSLDDGSTLFSTKVTNSQGVELPNTGGIGQYIFVILGGSLAIFAAYLYYVKFKKNGTESSVSH